jgi:hypothetical protein
MPVTSGFDSITAITALATGMTLVKSTGVLTINCRGAAVAATDYVFKIWNAANVAYDTINIEIVVHPHELTSVSPTTWKRDSGSTVSLAGFTFGSSRGTGKVLMGDSTASAYTAWTDSTITWVTKKYHALGTVAIKVINNAGDTSNGVNVTITGDTVTPKVSIYSPADGDTNIDTSANLVLTFSERVIKGTGSLRLYKGADSSLVDSSSIDSSAIVVSGTGLTWSLPVSLDTMTAYFVEADAGAVTDTIGNNWGGIANATTWNWTTGKPSTSTRLGLGFGFGFGFFRR